MEGKSSSCKTVLANDAAVNILVLQADNSSFGLVVDEIKDMEEIVVKPLGKLLKGIPVFAGVTITGSGKVALILDVIGIAQHAHVVSKLRSEEVLIEKGTKAEEIKKDSIHVVVYTRNGYNVGIVVNNILDIVEDTLSVKQPPGRDGVLFSAVIQNRVTELLDVEAIINAAGPKLFDPQPALKGLGV